MKYIVLPLLLSVTIQLNAMSVESDNSVHQISNVIEADLKKEPTNKRPPIQPIIIPQRPVMQIAGVQTIDNILYYQPKNQGIELLNRFNDYAVYIDGIKIIGEPNIPLSSIDYITYMERGIPAEYGDLSYGRITQNAEGYAFITPEY